MVFNFTVQDVVSLAFAEIERQHWVAELLVNQLTIEIESACFNTELNNLLSVSKISNTQS